MYTEKQLVYFKNNFDEIMTNLEVIQKKYNWDLTCITMARRWGNNGDFEGALYVLFDERDKLRAGKLGEYCNKTIFAE